MTDSTNDTTSKSDLIILLLGSLTLSYSTYQTAQGYKLAAGGLFQAWIYAIMILLALAYLLIQLRSNLKVGKINKGLLILIVYLVVACFSFAANFNAFYSNAMRKELLYDDLEILQSELTSLKTKAFVALDKTHNADSLKEKVTLLKTTLINQILDKGASGFGSKSDTIARRISQLLGVELTKPAGTAQLIANSVSEQIDQLLADKIKSITQKSNDLEKKINTITDNIQFKVDSVKRTENTEDDYSVLEEGVKVYNNIGEEVTQTIHNLAVFRFERKTFFNLEIGKISHSFKSASSHKQDAIIAGIQSGFIDLLVPVLLFFSTVSYSGNNSSNTSQRFPKRKEKSKEKDNAIHIKK